MKFKVGDIVGLVDSIGKGRVIEIVGIEFYKVYVEDEEMEYNISGKKLFALTLDNKLNDFNFTEDNEKKSIVKHSFKIQSCDRIDLHYEKIPNEFKQSNSTLEAQLAYYKHCLEKAKSNKTNEIIFIHGQGKGILRQEIIKFAKTKNFKSLDPEFDLRKKKGTIKIILIN